MLKEPITIEFSYTLLYPSSLMLQNINQSSKSILEAKSMIFQDDVVVLNVIFDENLVKTNYFYYHLFASFKNYILLKLIETNYYNKTTKKFKRFKK